MKKSIWILTTLLLSSSTLRAEDVNVDRGSLLFSRWNRGVTCQLFEKVRVISYYTNNSPNPVVEERNMDLSLGGKLKGLMFLFKTDYMESCRTTTANFDANDTLGEFVGYPDGAAVLLYRNVLAGKEWRKCENTRRMMALVIQGCEI